MGLTLTESKQLMLKYINEYSTDGAIISEQENLDYLLKHNQFANKVQFELAKLIKIPAVYKITQNPIPNQLGLLFGFDVKQYRPDEGDYILTAVGTKSYYFEVDNIATVYIEENINGVWTVKETISNTTKGQFTAYKNLISLVNTTNEVRIRFSGSYVYNIRNTAMFKYTFPTASDIPIYKPYTYYDMPSDFMELDEIVQEGNERVYRETLEFYWENRKRLRLNYYDVGSFDVHYWRYPTKITDSTPDTYEYEVIEEAAQLIPIKVAALVVPEEKSTIFQRLLQLYEVELSRIVNTEVTKPQQVQSIYSILGGG